jgi:hypothetical protein
LGYVVDDGVVALYSQGLEEVKVTAHAIDLNTPLTFLVGCCKNIIQYYREDEY